VQTSFSLPLPLFDFASYSALAYTACKRNYFGNPYFEYHHASIMIYQSLRDYNAMVVRYDTLYQETNSYISTTEISTVVGR
jgi:hypothetical protein